MSKVRKDHIYVQLHVRLYDKYTGRMGVRILKPELAAIEIVDLNYKTNALLETPVNIYVQKLWGYNKKINLLFLKMYY